VLDHTGTVAFYEHLCGVQAVFERTILQNLIGIKAEFFVWVFLDGG